MPRTLLEEVNEYISSKSPLEFSTIFGVGKQVQNLEDDISAKFRGTLGRGTKTLNAHVIQELGFNSPEGRLYTYCLTEDQNGYYSLKALENMKRISESDLTLEEKERYTSYKKRLSK